LATQSLQQALNDYGADITMDGEFGERTRNAVIECQSKFSMEETGIADAELLTHLNLLNEKMPITADYIEVTGNTVNIRTGPGTEYDPVFIAHRGERYQKVNVDDWTAIRSDDSVLWISDKYIEK